MTADLPVLIVGGGPVGLSLAAELGWRNIPAMVVERRTEPTAHPKATLVGARSMELFRRWGIDGDVFDAAMPPDLDYFITFSTRLNGHLFSRFVSPSIGVVRSRDPAGRQRFPELNWSAFAKTQIGQQALEPVLIRRVQALDSIELRHGWQLVDWEDNGDDGVSARIERISDGRQETVRSRYMVACDGGTSRIRKKLAVPMLGRGAMRANVSFFFRSPDFLKAHDLGVANLYFIFTSDSFGVFTAIDGKELWNYQYYFLDPAKETEALDPTAILHRAVGQPFDFELLHTTHWHHHQSVAAKWRHGNVFLAGDAAHLFSPTGGVGMNTGIGDAVDLGWKLAAVIDGWGGDWLLESYEAERKPIAVRNSTISANNSDKIDMVMEETPADIEAEGPHGDWQRAVLSDRIRWLSRQFHSAGTHMGYRYSASPIVVADGTPEPPDDPAVVVPSARPGARAPHVWLPDGRSSLDLFGRDWTLLCLDGDASASDNLLSVAGQTGMQIDVVEISNPDMAAVYQSRYVLVRPDGHVAWRGDAIPAEVSPLLDRVRGVLPPDYLAALVG
ncbi:MAG: FAD-dependent monooxygenase [Rhodospirillales bacterium]